MWRQIILAVFITSSSALFSQDAGKQSAIVMEFSAPSIMAFQESSQTKVNDFYQYLSLLTEPLLTPELKEQVKKNIYALFEDEQIEIADFISGNTTKMTLAQFLKKVENLEKTTFSVIEIHSSPVSYGEYWLNSYTLQMDAEKGTTTKNINQKIYFNPEQKEFGSTQKRVWSLRLGEIE